MKDNTIYNRPDNKVFIKTNGDLIYVICNRENQQEAVVKRMTTDNCMLEHYEEWDVGKDKIWILTLRVLNEYELKPNLN